MKKIAITLLVVAALAGGSFLAYQAFRDPSLAGDKIEDFDQLIARVDSAVAAGRVAPHLVVPTCQASEPLHIGALALNVAHGKEVLECISELWPGGPLRGPLAIVDVDARRFDAMTSRMPPALQAASLQAAGTIALAHCGKKKVGSYGFIFTHDALAQVCNLLLLGQEGSGQLRVLGVSYFYYGPPQKIDERFTFGDVVASRPDFNMESALRGYFAPAASAQ
jgi:hypothetical protein